MATVACKLSHAIPTVLAKAGPRRVSSLHLSFISSALATLGVHFDSLIAMFAMDQRLLEQASSSESRDSSRCVQVQKRSRPIGDEDEPVRHGEAIQKTSQLPAPDFSQPGLPQPVPERLGSRLQLEQQPSAARTQTADNAGTAHGGAAVDTACHRAFEHVAGQWAVAVQVEGALKGMSISSLARRSECGTVLASHQHVSDSCCSLSCARPVLTLHANCAAAG